LLKGVAIATSVAALSASCSSGHSSAPSPNESKGCASTTSAAGWTRADLHPVSQPYVAGCNFVVFDASGIQLRVVALDASTGRTVWQSSVSRSAVTPGVTPGLAIVGDAVALLHPVATETARLVGLNASDGGAAWASAPGVFTGWPAPCADDSSVVCVTGTAGQRTREFRFDGATGNQLSSPVVSSAPDGRDLAADLFDPATRNPDRLVATSGGAIAWTRTLAGVFNKPGLSTDYGWNFDRVAAAGLFVGSVGGPPLSRTATTAVVDLGSDVTTGFRLNTGAPVWRQPGTQYLCSVLPCAGPVPPAGTGAPATSVFGLRLRGTGTAHASEGAPPVLSPDAKFTLEGFDLATGRTSWSFDEGKNLSLVESLTPPQLDAERVVLPAPNGGHTVVDLASGKRSAVEPGTTLWCQKETTYKLSVSFTDELGNDHNTYQGANAIFPCDENGRALKAPTHVPTFVGPAVNGVVAWSEPGSVSAAPS
jgi:outer membrane protein assembly factor BamB